MRNKYHARQVITGDGQKFDSKKEFRRWRELQLLQRAGKISGLQRQVPIQLIPAQYEPVERISEKTGSRLKDGRRCVERAVVYVADFTYYEGNRLVVEDAKGVRTPEYIIKRKLLLWQHGVKIKEV